MTIRTRLTMWFAAVLVGAILAMGVLSYREFVIEPRLKAQSARLKPTRENLETDPPLEEIIEALAWSGVPALLLGLGGGWWLMRRALEPVAALSGAAERLNEHHLSERLARSGNGDELDRMTEVFNRMAERIEHSFARIREFTLYASHELKTPLTVMHGELEMALQRPSLSEAERDRLESEINEVQRLSRIVDGLTLLTKADAGQIRLEKEPVKLEELVSEACADGQSLARAQHIDVSLVLSEQVSIIGDRHRLRQLLLNLTDNAIKYNREGGKVILKLRRINGHAEVTIANTGEGISPELLPRVFDPFFRGDTSHSQMVDGCGLGLSIARWIVVAHGGTIELASTPKQLTTALVRLPAGPEEKNGNKE